MAITIEQREHGQIVVLIVTGRLTATECQGTLRKAVHDLVEHGRKHVVFDCEAVPFVDSAGLGEMVSGYASVARLGGSLTLANTNHRVRSAIDAARLTHVLQLGELPDRQPATSR